MHRIDTFKNAVSRKEAVKVIAGIENHNIENIKNVVTAANQGGAHAIDICYGKEIFDIVRGMTELPIFVSSINAEELAHAVEYGCDGIEIGNYDAIYRKGTRISAEEVLNIATRVKELTMDKHIYTSVTIPGHIEISEQINLARRLENMGFDIIQTEGAATINTQKTGSAGLLETASVSISNTMDLTSNIEIPVMTASGISVKTAPLAFAAGASAIGVGSAVNRCENLISMIASVRSIVEASSRIHHTSSEMIHA